MAGLGRTPTAEQAPGISRFQPSRPRAARMTVLAVNWGRRWHRHAVHHLHGDLDTHSASEREVKGGGGDVMQRGSAPLARKRSDYSDMAIFMVAVCPDLAATERNAQSSMTCHFRSAAFAQGSQAVGAVARPGAWSTHPQLTMYCAPGGSAAEYRNSMMAKTGPNVTPLFWRIADVGRPVVADLRWFFRAQVNAPSGAGSMTLTRAG